MPREPVADHAVGDVESVTLGASVEQSRARRGPVEVGLDLEQQATLAESRIRQDRDQAHRPLGASFVEELRQLRHLGVATHHADRRRGAVARGLGTARRHAKGTRLGALDQVGRDRLVDPLQRERRLRLDIEQAPHVAIGIATDAHAARRRGLLHVRGDLHRQAADPALRVEAAAEQPAAGMHADAHVEAVVAVEPADRCALCAAFLDQCQPRVHRAFRVVFAREVRAEDGEQAVTRVLQDTAAMHRDDVRAALERAVHQRVDLLGIEVLAQGGGSDHVEEENRDLPQRLDGRVVHGRGDGCKSGDQRRDGQIDHRVARRLTRGDEGRDRGLDLLLLGGHRARISTMHCTPTPMKKPARGRPRDCSGGAQALRRRPAKAAITSPNPSNATVSGSGTATTTSGDAAALTITLSR